MLVGGGLDFKMGRSLKFPKVPHNRLLLRLAHGFGHRIEKFGNPDFCGGGPLNLTLIAGARSEARAASPSLRFGL